MQKKSKELLTLEARSNYQDLKFLNSYASSREKIMSRTNLDEISLKEFSTFDNRPLNVSMNIKKLKSKINFKLKNIRNITVKMVNKNNVKSKIFKRR